MNLLWNLFFLVTLIHSVHIYQQFRLSECQLSKFEYYVAKLSPIKRFWLLKHILRGCHGNLPQILCEIYGACLHALYLWGCRVGSHAACNDMQASHRPRGNGILLKPLMGPYGIMNTLRRARALIVGPPYLDTYIITRSDESVANSAALWTAAHKTNC